MAILIDGKDSLNVGREKLNNAILALNQTLHGDSSLESAAARVNENGTVYTNLKERLDAEHSELNTNLATKAPQTALNNLQTQLNNTIVSASNYYNKCLSTDTGALLIVASGATSGQINLASVSPKLDTYNPIVGDYVRLVSNGLTAELIDVRIGADGIIDSSAGVSTRRQFNSITSDLVNLSDNMGGGKSNFYKSLYKTNWLLGKSFGSSGFVTDARYFCSEQIILMKKDSFIYNDNLDFYYAYGIYDSNGIYTSSNYDNKQYMTFANDTYIRIAIKFNDNRAMTNEYMETALSSFYTNSIVNVTFLNEMATTNFKKYFSYDKGSNLDSSVSTRMHINNVNLDGIDTLYIDGNYKVSFYGYNRTTGAEIVQDLWATYEYKVTSGLNYSIVVKKDETTAMSPINDSKCMYYYDKPKMIWSFMGDSITEGVNTSITYHAYLSTFYNIVANNYGANGSCISTYTLPEVNYSYCMCKRVETIDKNSDVIFVFGGTNDFNRGCPLGEFYSIDSNGNRTFSTDTNTFKGALSVMFGYLKKTFPTKEIIVLTPIHRGIFGTQPTDMQKNVTGLYLEDYVNAIKEACELFSVSNVIDLYTLSGLNPNIVECADEYFHNSGSIDNLHPNEKGHLRIANTIKKHLNS